MHNYCTYTHKLFKANYVNLNNNLEKIPPLIYSYYNLLFFGLHIVMHQPSPTTFQSPPPSGIF